MVTPVFMVCSGSVQATRLGGFVQIKNKCLELNEVARGRLSHTNIVEQRSSPVMHFFLYGARVWDLGSGPYRAD